SITAAGSPGSRPRTTVGRSKVTVPPDLRRDEPDDVVVDFVGALHMQEVPGALDHHHLRTRGQEVSHRADGVDAHATVILTVEIQRGLWRDRSARRLRGRGLRIVRWAGEHGPVVPDGPAQAP